ncbi:stage V sporulation protein D [Anoxybacterium hadale]|uniref:Stage V sporulation protein D n=1 Tax=Anoxybacterium hadale TaxID=3408580 RepID=A0ACD1AF22_9FIRM|nr:stage V sporulation protein D [Clostridiales bacterium]
MNEVKRRLIFLFMIINVVLISLAFRIGWVQIVSGEKYEKIAKEQQTRDQFVPAKRGSIYDRNGKELAVSAVTHSVWVRPAALTNPRSKKTKEDQLTETAAALASILSLDQDSVRASMNTKRNLVKIAKYVEKEKVDQIRDRGLYGVEITEEVKRYYPMGAFAAHVLGSTTDENRGLMGIELEYDQYLSGMNGRFIYSADRDGGNLISGREKFFQAKDGWDIVLTIDAVIQMYVENALDRVREDTAADRVMCIVMDPETGDILAMAMNPDFDPGNPRVPLDGAEAAYLETLSDSKKLDYWNSMWRNPMVSDTYEPGSTFKLLTTAIALQEGVTSPEDIFYDTGKVNVAGTVLKCLQWRNPHGRETLVEAVENSCNPVFVELARRIGIEKYYDYLELFGLTQRTGIDFPGEGLAILQKQESAGPVGLATMSYGQGIAVTPIQLITAISAIGNEGKIMKPRLVKEMMDGGNVVWKNDIRIERQILSKKTTEEMTSIMESVVDEGGGIKAKISGYRIGGKTGTANKAFNGGYSEDTYSSFIGMAPIEDSRISILLIVDNPKGVKAGSLTAAPGVKDILENTLRYMRMKPTDSGNAL